MNNRYMGKPLLSICIPTYNRKQPLISTIKNILSVNDSRFEIVVSNNASTDGTEKALKILAKDDRLSYKTLPDNLGGIFNGVNSINMARGTYILYLLDKDSIDITYLPFFLDFLDESNPYFGYFDIEHSGNIDTFPAGYSASTKFGFQSLHPSLIFFRANLLKEEMSKYYFIRTNFRCDFWMDMIMGILGTKFPGVIIHKPVIITDIYQKNRARSLSFNASNIWFGYRKRAEDFEFYTYALVNSEIEKDLKKSLLIFVSDKFIHNVSYVYAYYFCDENVQQHYYLNSKIRKKDLIINLIKGNIHFIRIMSKHMSLFWVSRILLFLMKRSFIYYRESNSYVK